MLKVFLEVAALASVAGVGNTAGLHEEAPGWRVLISERATSRNTIQVKTSWLNLPFLTCSFWSSIPGFWKELGDSSHHVPAFSSGSGRESKPPRNSSVGIPLCFLSMLSMGSSTHHLYEVARIAVTNYLKLNGLNNKLSQFWRLKVWNQGFDQVVSLWELCGESWFHISVLGLEMAFPCISLIFLCLLSCLFTSPSLYTYFWVQIYPSYKNTNHIRSGTSL
jgi:hypothetical protein